MSKRKITDVEINKIIAAETISQAFTNKDYGSCMQIKTLKLNSDSSYL